MGRNPSPNHGSRFYAFYFRSIPLTHSLSQLKVDIDAEWVVRPYPQNLLNSINFLIKNYNHGTSPKGHRFHGSANPGAVCVWGGAPEGTQRRMEYFETSAKDGTNVKAFLGVRASGALYPLPRFGADLDSGLTRNRLNTTPKHQKKEDIILRKKNLNYGSKVSCIWLREFEIVVNFRSKKLERQDEGFFRRIACTAAGLGNTERVLHPPPPNPPPPRPGGDGVHVPPPPPVARPTATAAIGASRRRRGRGGEGNRCRWI